MNHLYDRGWFRLALYNANTEGELIHLISVLRQKLYDTKDDEMFNSLSDEEKQKLLDTIKTSINVCWDRCKKVISDYYLKVDDKEREYYNGKSKKLRKLEGVPKPDFSQSGLYDKTLFKNEFEKVCDPTEYLFLIMLQLPRLENTMQCDAYAKLHVLDKRKQKDLYFSSITQCWKAYNESILFDFPLMLETKKKIALREHVLNRRERHRLKGIKKREWKDNKNSLIQAMLDLPEDEFNRVQKELEMEYRRTRGLPDVPEV